MIARHLHITGRVQGVAFRHHTQKTALSLGLSGWVRNLSDGSVEILVQGPPDPVARLVLWCRTGSPGARVTGVEQRDEPVLASLSGFHIRF